MNPSLQTRSDVAAADRLALGRREGLTLGEKLAAILLFDYARLRGQKGRVAIDAKQLSVLCGCSERAAGGWLPRLAAAGILELVERFSAHGPAKGSWIVNRVDLRAGHGGDGGPDAGLPELAVVEGDPQGVLFEPATEGGETPGAFLAVPLATPPGRAAEGNGERAPGVGLQPSVLSLQYEDDGRVENPPSQKGGLETRPPENGAVMGRGKIPGEFAAAKSAADFSGTESALDPLLNQTLIEGSPDSDPRFPSKGSYSLELQGRGKIPGESAGGSLQPSAFSRQYDEGHGRAGVFALRGATAIGDCLQVAAPGEGMARWLANLADVEEELRRQIPWPLHRASLRRIAELLIDGEITDRELLRIVDATRRYDAEGRLTGEHGACVVRLVQQKLADKHKSHLWWRKPR